MRLLNYIFKLRHQGQKKKSRTKQPELTNHIPHRLHTVFTVLPVKTTTGSVAAQNANCFILKYLNSHI